jgi:dihydroorotate dehydrogenase (fumarate)
MNLTTSYLGLELKNPVIPSAGPISQEISNIKLMEDSGAAAVVLYSLFEEQIEHETLELHHYTTANTESNPESISYFPEVYDFKTSVDGYLEHIRKAKESVSIPVIASLNGRSLGSWIEFAKKIEQAGADALELNIYKLAADFKVSGVEIEKEHVEIVKEVKMNLGIPVAVKLHPFFTSVSNIAHQLDEVGADGLVFFNRFYQPDIDLETLEVVPNVLLSTPMAMRLPLRWIAILYNRLNADLAATSGVYNEKDIIKLVMAGAKATHMMSSLLKFGIGHISEVLSKLVYWMEANEYESLDQMRGSMSYMNVADPSGFERANYMKVLNSIK